MVYYSYNQKPFENTCKHNKASQSLECGLWPISWNCEYEDQIKEEDEKSYEASFPGTENGL